MPVVTLTEMKSVLPERSRVMGIDHGSKTLGLALSDPTLSIATPLKTLIRTKFTENLKQIATICAEYNVRAFVIGLPLHMNGDEGARVDSVRSFGRNIIHARESLGFDPLIAFWDERLSTFAVESFLIEERNMSRRKRDEVIDALAAQHILQGALDAMQREFENL